MSSEPGNLPVKPEFAQVQPPAQQPFVNTPNKYKKWGLVLLGVVIFGGLFGAGVYGIMHAFDLFGVLATEGEQLFITLAPFGLIGGGIYFLILSIIYSKHPDGGTYVLKTIGNFILFTIMGLLFSFATVVVLDSQSVIDRYDSYLIAKNESRRQAVIDRSNLSISFQPNEVISYGINEEFSALVVKGSFEGLLSASQITSYMNIVAMDKLSINGEDIQLPKPDQWTNWPSTITLGTDEPPHVSFGSDTQELNLYVIIPASSINIKTPNNISGTISIWSQSDINYNQEILWSQEISIISKPGDMSTAASELQNYLQYRK